MIPSTEQIQEIVAATKRRLHLYYHPMRPFFSIWNFDTLQNITQLRNEAIVGMSRMHPDYQGVLDEMWPLLVRLSNIYMYSMN